MSRCERREDGNISLKGKAGVMVLIDGRPTELGGNDLANLLRNLSSSQQDQIEVMTNPPAKYESAVMQALLISKQKRINSLDTRCPYIKLWTRTFSKNK